MGQMLWANYNPNNTRTLRLTGLQCLTLTRKEEATRPRLAEFYTTSLLLGALTLRAADPLRAVVYVIFMTAIVTVFSRLWVELGGLSARTAARNLLDADVQVPGLQAIWRVLSRPCSTGTYLSLTLLSGMIIGLLAGISDVLNVFGTGTGILLMVNIMVSYYQTLVKEQVDTYMPNLAALIGRRQ